MPNLNIPVIVYLAAFLGLAAYGLWDVTQIINDYIQDNRVTSVRQKTIENRVPFLGMVYFTLKYECLLFPRCTPNITWNDICRMLNATWHDEDIPWPMEISQVEKDVMKGILENFLLYNVISDLDYNGAYNIDNVANYLQISTPQLTAMINNFVANPDSINFTTRAWSGAKNFFVMGQMKEVKPVLLHLAAKTAVFALPIADDWSIKNEQFVNLYIFDMVYWGAKAEAVYGLKAADMEITLSSGLWASDPDTYGGISGDISLKGGGPKEGMMYTAVKIQNSGVFDSQLFPPCTKKFQTEEECLYDIKLDTIVDVCKCTPFRRLWTQAFWNNDSIIYDSSATYCTVENYQKCWNQAFDEAKRRMDKAKIERVCRPCIFSKNTYTFQTVRYSSLIPADLYMQWKGRTTISFESKDVVYLYFEEKPQFNMAQFIAQIGGDLGLYIGFSVISFLELFLFLYYMHQRHKETPNFDQSSSNFCVKWFRFIVRYLGRSFSDSKDGESAESSDQNLSESKQSSGSILNQIQALEKRMNQKVDGQMEIVKNMLLAQTRELEELKATMATNGQARLANRIRPIRK